MVWWINKWKFSLVAWFLLILCRVYVELQFIFLKDFFIFLFISSSWVIYIFNNIIIARCNHLFYACIHSAVKFHHTKKNIYVSTYIFMGAPHFFPAIFSLPIFSLWHFVPRDFFSRHLFPIQIFPVTLIYRLGNVALYTSKIITFSWILI